MESIYTAPFRTKVHTKRSGMDHTVLPANNTMPAFLSWAFTRWHHHNTEEQTSNCSLLLIYRARKDERLSWPGWLTYSGWFTHISCHRSATGRAQDSESTPAKDRCSTAGPRNQLQCLGEGVRGSRQLRLSWQPLQCTSLGLDCAPLLQCLRQLILPPSMGW